MRVSDLRARHIKGIIEDGSLNINGITKQASPNIKCRIKSLFNLMLDYAVEYDIADKNYARTFKISKGIIEDAKEAKVDNIVFTPEELKVLWENINVDYVDVILFQCYTGLGPQELGLLEVLNLNINE